jgi:hypothetical protein
MFIKKLLILCLCVFAVSCATTSLDDSWKSDDVTHPYQKPMIIGISDSQQTRQIFEKHFIATLKQNNITATPSYTLINSKQKINRETIVNAIQGTDIDAVLVTYRVADEAEFVPGESIVKNGHEGHEEHNHMSATIVTKRGRSRSSEIFMLKTDMYAVDTKSLVWSAQTESVGPDSVDQVVTEVIDILIKELFADDMLTEESLTDELLKYINIQ